MIGWNFISLLMQQRLFVWKKKKMKGESVLHILHLNKSQQGPFEQRFNGSEYNHRGTSPKNMSTRGGKALVI